MEKRYRGLLALTLWIGFLVVGGAPSALAAAQTQTPRTAAASVTTSDMFATAQKLMGIRYKWGGTTTSGLDCSAFLSLVWEVPRQTTDTLLNVAYPIARGELAPGDALNLPTAADPRHRGHVRLFAGWADPDKYWMWVYEEARPRSSYHMVPYDPRYTPLRRENYQPSNDSNLTPPLLPEFPLDLTDPRLPYSLET